MFGLRNLLAGGGDGSATCPLKYYFIPLKGTGFLVLPSYFHVWEKSTKEKDLVFSNKETILLRKRVLLCIRGSCRLFCVILFFARTLFFEYVFVCEYVSMCIRVGACASSILRNVKKGMKGIMITLIIVIIDFY